MWRSPRIASCIDTSFSGGDGPLRLLCTVNRSFKTSRSSSCSRGPSTHTSSSSQNTSLPRVSSSSERGPHRPLRHRCAWRSLFSRQERCEESGDPDLLEFHAARNGLPDSPWQFIHCVGILCSEGGLLHCKLAHEAVPKAQNQSAKLDRELKPLSWAA